MPPKSKFYAVKRGFKTGIFPTWGEVRPLVIGFKGAQHRSFTDKTEALNYLKEENPAPKLNTTDLNVSNNFQKQHMEKYKSMLTPYEKMDFTAEDELRQIYDVYTCPVNGFQFALINDVVFVKLGMGKEEFSWSSKSAYLFIDYLDKYSVIFDNYSFLKAHEDYRKKCLINGQKSSVFTRKVPNVRYAYKYITNTFYDLEEKYMTDKNISHIKLENFKPSAESTIYAYCDGSSNSKTMGRGIYYDLDQLQSDERTFVSRFLKEHGGRPDRTNHDNKQTNNIAELSACQRVFQDLVVMYEMLNKLKYRKIFNVVIHTDSSYSIFAIEKHLVNIDLKDEKQIINGSYIDAAVKPYLQLKTFYRKFGAEDLFKLKWVPGHVDVAGNIAADKLAYNAMKGMFVNNSIDRVTVDEEVDSSDRAAVSQSDSDSDIEPLVIDYNELEKDDVFTARLCQILQRSYDYQSSSFCQRSSSGVKLLQHLEKLKKSFETDYDLNPLDSSTKKKFSWIDFKAKLLSYNEKYDSLRSQKMLINSIETLSDELVKKRNMLGTVTKSLEEGKSEEPQAYHQIRKLKTKMSTLEKQLKVSRDYLDINYPSSLTRSPPSKKNTDNEPSPKKQKLDDSSSFKINPAAENKYEGYEVVELSSSSD